MIILTASVIGCGKEEAQDSSSNVKEETEDTESINNQSGENNSVENIVKVELSEEDSKQNVSEIENESEQKDTQGENSVSNVGEDESANSGKEKYTILEGSVWDLTEEEKQASYEAFCEKRTSHQRNDREKQLRKCEWYWSTSGWYRVVADDPDNIPIYVGENVSLDIYSCYADILVSVVNETDLVLFDAEGNEVLLYSSDEPIREVETMENCTFFGTESADIYRVHHLSQRVDFVANIGIDWIARPYDSMSILCYDPTLPGREEGYEPEEVYRYYDIEKGLIKDIPDDYSKLYASPPSLEELDATDALYAEFEANRTRFIPDEGKNQPYMYELDEEGNLLCWDKNEDKSTAKIIDKNVQCMCMWNEYVYYYADDGFIRRVNGVSAKQWIEYNHDYDTLEIVANDEYIFTIHKGGRVARWVLEFGYPKQKNVLLSDGIHNLRVVDNMSFLYDDLDGNTRYYDMETNSEQPVPEDAVGM